MKTFLIPENRTVNRQRRKVILVGFRSGRHRERLPGSERRIILRSLRYRAGGDHGLEKIRIDLGNGALHSCGEKDQSKSSKTGNAIFSREPNGGRREKSADLESFSGGPRTSGTEIWRWRRPSPFRRNRVPWRLSTFLIFVWRMGGFEKWRWGRTEGCVGLNGRKKANGEAVVEWLDIRIQIIKCTRSMGMGGRLGVEPWGA